MPDKEQSTKNTEQNVKITALAGGVGAAKLLLGLSGVMRAEDITVVSNTGDDIEFFGLRVCPDIDTVLYTLAGVINEKTGWGIRDDSFESLRWMARYGGPSWFNLGDKDLATHIYRSDQLRQGRTLTEVTKHLAASLGVGATVLPMTDHYTPTRIVTDEGEMHFQEYFVRRRCELSVKAIRFDNIETATPAVGVLEAIREADAVLVCPSNPFISVGPILAVPGIRQALRETRATVIAVTPIVGGRALKGPAADMLRDLGHEVSALGVAKLYSDFADLFVLDEQDDGMAASIEAVGVRVKLMDTLMNSLEDKQRLAGEVLAAL